MANCKLITFEARADGGSLCFQGVSPETLSADVAQFFQQQGYRLEMGTPASGVYGIGSDLMRILFGAFARRYKFNIAMQNSDANLWLHMTKGMSGAMGGVIGYSAMNKESKRVFEALTAYFS